MEEEYRKISTKEILEDVIAFAKKHGRKVDVSKSTIPVYSMVERVPRIIVEGPTEVHLEMKEENPNGIRGKIEWKKNDEQSV